MSILERVHRKVSIYILEMGNSLRQLTMRDSIAPARVLMVGLDASGKTSILYKMKLGEVVTTIPTNGFNVETIQCQVRRETLCFSEGLLET